MNHYIRDLQGQLIKVTDLNEAITHTAAYIGILYQQQDPLVQAFVQSRQQYWKDIFQKLGRLKVKSGATEVNELSTDELPSHNP